MTSVDHDSNAEASHRRRSPSTAERPKKQPKSTLTIRIDPYLRASLHQAAHDRGLSMNWLATYAIQHLLDSLIPVDEIVLTRSHVVTPTRSPSIPDDPRPVGAVDVTPGVPPGPPDGFLTQIKDAVSNNDTSR